MKRHAGSFARGLTVVAVALAIWVAPVQAGFVFDLADGIGGGNGSLPGTGGAGNIAAVSPYSATPPNAYVNGTFIPNSAAGTVQIDGAGNTYDFDSQCSAGYYNPWINGNNLDMDPSGGVLPNFSTDTNNHSLIAAHANKGITFDLAAIRTATGKTPNLFTTCAGDSRPKGGGSISYFVFVDGALQANRNGVIDSEDYLFVPLSSTASYLTLVIADNNNGIGADHGYFGDAFLRQATVWNGSTDGNWNNGNNWVGGTAPTSGTSTEVWITGDSNVTAMSQNVASPFVLNRLEVTGTGMTNAVSISGSQLSFQADGTLNPTLHVSRNTAVTLAANLNLANQLTLTVDDLASGDDLTVSGQVTGSGNLLKYGAGNAVFNGSNGGFSGSIVVNAGTLTVGGNANAYPLGTASARTVTINAGGTLTALAGSHNPFGTGTGVPTVIINGGTMNTAQYQHTTNLDMTGGTIKPTGAEADGLDMRGAPSTVTTHASANQATISSKMTIRNTVVFDVADGSAATDLLMSGAMVGPGGFTKTGAGLMSTTGVLSFTGGITVTGGTLKIANTNTFSGGLDIQGGTVQLAYDYALPSGSGKGNITVNGTLDLAGTRATVNGLAGSGTITSTTGGAPILYVGANNTSSSFNGTVANTSGTLQLYKIGTGTLTLGGTSTYNGLTTVGSGKVVLASNTSLPSGSGKGDVLVEGTLDVAGYAPTVNGLSGTGTVDNSSGNGVLTVGANNASSTFYGKIQNSGGTLALTKIGGGTVTLGGANTYSGATTVTAGTLKMAPTSAAPAASSAFWVDAANASTITASGGLVSQWNSVNGDGWAATQASGGNQPTLVAGGLNGLPVVDFGAWGSGKWMQWTLTGTATTISDIRTVFSVMGSQNGGGYVLSNTGAAQFHRGPAPAGAYNPGDYRSYIWGWDTPAAVTGGQTYLDGEIVSGTTTNLNGGYQLVSVVTTGNASANNFANDRNNIPGRTGGQQLAEVIIYNRALTEAERLATEAYLMQKWFGASAGAILPAGTALQVQGGATVDLNGTTQTVASLGDYSGTGGTVTNSAAGAALLAVSGAANTTFSGSLVDGAGTLALLKAGTGALTLAGTNNTLTGGTTVQAGSLLVTGSLDGTVTVNGGTLGGTGSVGNIVAISGSVAPGLSAGELKADTVIFWPDSFFDVQLNPVEWDLLTVGESVILNDPILNLLDLPSLSHYQGSQYMILQNNSTDPITGTFLNLPEGALFEAGGNQFAITYIGGEGNNDVVLTSVPEPATGLLLALALPAVAARLRRRRR
ncbi:MAG: Autotransporter-associated beta strand repeat protein [Planctomycetes bacterium ADurb.Bin126]|nr:MAG: Autotransporter-associated beta strand repeat protein [Planctomycetes bacterium ADurb.Bin126]